jgi:tRNA pseudouridine38-40 synthase
MPRRLKLIIAYDGAPFAGWQSQTHSNTIQDHLERAFARINGQRIRVHGAGRTDAGVHALGQCAHADIENDRLSAERWTMALNALLPSAIRVMRCRYVSNRFHARFSAKGKIYRYRVCTLPIVPPFESKRVWHVSAPLNFDALKLAALKFRGTHDFSRFAATRGNFYHDTERTIRDVRVRHRRGEIVIEFDGDGFLYKMVRLMVGAIKECAAGKIDAEQITQELKNSKVKSRRFCAPPDGLYLVRVRY